MSSQNKPSLSTSILQSPLRTAFALEAAANIFGAACMLAYPSQILSWAAPPSLTSPSPLSQTLLHWLAGLVIGLTPPLVLGVPQTRSARASRWTVYGSLLAGEIGLGGVMIWSALRGERLSGVRPEAIWTSVATLAGFAAWRVWVMVRKPEWFESGDDEAGAKRM